MFEWLGSFLDQVIVFFQWIWDFLTVGIYAFIKDAMVLLTKGAMYSWFQIQLFALEVAYESAQQIMGDLGVADAVRQRYGSLPGEVASTMEFFGIPQALNIIFSALSTRFALKFVPFIGR